MEAESGIVGTIGRAGLGRGWPAAQGWAGTGAGGAPLLSNGDD